MLMAGDKFALRGPLYKTIRDHGLRISLRQAPNKQPTWPLTSTFLSGWGDLNSRPLDPQSRCGRDVQLCLFREHGVSTDTTSPPPSVTVSGISGWAGVLARRASRGVKRSLAP